MRGVGLQAWTFPRSTDRDHGPGEGPLLSQVVKPRAAQPQGEECSRAPPHIGEPVRDLTKAGFVRRGRKGSHRNYVHSSGVNVTLSGGDRDDAKPYQEKAVREALERCTS